MSAATDLLAQSGLLGGVLRDTDALALLLAALCHDLEHPGRTNGFLIRTRDRLARLDRPRITSASCRSLQTPLLAHALPPLSSNLSAQALRYLDVSPLENHHASVGLTLIEKSGLLVHLPTEERTEVTRSFVAAILVRHTQESAHSVASAVLTPLLGPRRRAGDRHGGAQDAACKRERQARRRGRLPARVRPRRVRVRSWLPLLSCVCVRLNMLGVALSTHRSFAHSLAHLHRSSSGGEAGSGEEAVRSPRSSVHSVTWSDGGGGRDDDDDGRARAPAPASVLRRDLLHRGSWGMLDQSGEGAAAAASSTWLDSSAAAAVAPAGAPLARGTRLSGGHVSGGGGGRRVGSPPRSADGRGGAVVWGGGGSARSSTTAGGLSALRFGTPATSAAGGDGSAMLAASRRGGGGGGAGRAGSGAGSAAYGSRRAFTSSAADRRLLVSFLLHVADLHTPLLARAAAASGRCWRVAPSSSERVC